MGNPVTDGNQFDSACLMFNGEEQPFQSGIMVGDGSGLFPKNRASGIRKSKPGARQSDALNRARPEPARPFDIGKDRELQTG